LLFGGVPVRFPRLRFGFMEGGVAWAVSLRGDVVSHWEKRAGLAIDRYDPSRIDRRLVADLVHEYGTDAIRARADRIEEVLSPLGPDSFSARSTGPEISDLCPTLIQRLPGTETTLVSDTASLTIVGTTAKRGPSSSNVSASSCSQPYTVIPRCPVTSTPSRSAVVARSRGRGGASIMYDSPFVLARG